MSFVPTYVLDYLRTSVWAHGILAVYSVLGTCYHGNDLKFG